MHNLPVWVIAFYVAAAGVELYFFAMQRSALDTCRASGLPDTARFFMLPHWYRLGWIAIGLKWLAVVLIFLKAGWAWALGAAFLPLFISGPMPIPHSHFFPLFYSALEQLRQSPLSQQADILIQALDDAERKRGVRKT